MGRYKSLLQARIDARRFEHAVDVPVPKAGLGKELSRMYAWLNEHCQDDTWAQHGYQRGDYSHWSRSYFMYPDKADCFADKFGGERVDRIGGKWPAL